jgi:hypothetical protein
MNEIVWFGLKTEVSMTPMNQMDLYNCFNTMKRFRNPYNNGVEFFTISAIKKLLRIATSGSLRSVIVELLRDSDTVSERVENFKNEYNSMPSEMKERVQLFFNEFLYIGFYMRGWSGKGNYPIEETTVDDQANVDINVCTQWEKMNSLFPENDPLRMRIFELPLLDWRRERGFELSSGIGRNCIGDVFRIVFSMDRDMEVNACIRLSSNYICKSSFFYITRVLEKDAPFDVSLMHDIG